MKKGIELLNLALRCFEDKNDEISVNIITNAIEDIEQSYKSINESAHTVKIRHDNDCYGYWCNNKNDTKTGINFSSSLEGNPWTN